MERGFIDAATLCGLQGISFTEAKTWLENTNHTWLIIMDNADDSKIDYARYFPSGNRGNILMTTRIDRCSVHQTVGCKTFDKLEFDDAVTLLLKASGVEENQWKDSRHDAIEVVRILAQHALAIIQAGAFINQHLCKLKDYPQEFKRQRDRLLQFHDVQAGSTYGDVYATFEVSARVLETSSDQKSVDALNLLKILAHLHFEGVPEEMFTKAWTYSRILPGEGDDDDDDNDGEDLWHLSKWHVSYLPTFMRQLSSKDLDIISLRQAISVLCSFSIITVHAETGDISMHPLAHAWARDRLNPADRTSAWATTSAILALSMEGLHHYHEFWRKLQAHVEFCLDLHPDDCFKIHPALEIARTFSYFAWLLMHMRSDTRAKILVTFMHGKLSQECLLPPTTSRQIRYVTAACLNRAAEYKQAAAILEKAVQLDKEILDSTNPDRLDSQHELAWTYLGLEQYEKAAELLQEVVRIRQTTLDPTHRSRLASQHELARAYMGLKQYEKAAELLQEVVRIIQTTSDPTHPNCLTSLHELARAYIGLEQYEKAAELLQEVVRIEQTTLDPTHPKRLASQHGLAAAYIRLEQYEKAVELLQEVVRIRQTTLDPTHRSRLASQHELARAYMGLEQYEKAAELLQEVVRIRQKTLDPIHPYRLGSESLLSRCSYLLRNDLNAQSDLSMIPHQGNSESEDEYFRDEGKVVAKGLLSGFATAAKSKDSSQVVAEDGVVPIAAPKPKKRERALAFFQRRRH